MYIYIFDSQVKATFCGYHIHGTPGDLRLIKNWTSIRCQTNSKGITHTKDINRHQRHLQRLNPSTHKAPNTPYPPTQMDVDIGLSRLNNHPPLINPSSTPQYQTNL